MALNAWLEDLSEDWIPQQAPSTPGDTSIVSSATHNSTDLSASQRSRIPRFRTSAGSSSSVKAKNALSSSIVCAKRKSALGERSLSENNVSITGAPANTKTSPQGVQSSRSHSVSSDVQHGTVEQRPVPGTGEAQIHETPEWKRRLLKGEMGYGEQKDLFSPMGLENIFQQPKEQTPKPPTSHKRGLSFLNGPTPIPSSPPPWSFVTIPRQDLDMGNSLDGIEENSADESLPRVEVSPRVDVRIEGPQEAGVESPSLEPSEQHDESAPHGFSPSQLTQGDVAGSRTVSGQTELNNESFSPVYITKQNTINGGFNYAALDLSRSQLAERLGKLKMEQGESHDDSVASESRDSENIEGSSYAKLQDETLPDDLAVGTPEPLAAGGFLNTRGGGLSAEGPLRHHPLSPSPLAQVHSGRERAIPGVEETRPDGTTVKKSADAPDLSPEGRCDPNTPFQQAQDGPPSERVQSSGSPLKLFGNHDTFTSNRLQRRLSQLEEIEQFVQENKTGSSRRARTSKQLLSVEEASFVRSTGSGTQRSAPAAAGPKRISPSGYFGRGDLDQFRFTDGFSFSEGIDDSDREDSPPPEASPSPPKPKFRFNVGPTSGMDEYSRAKRRISNNSTRSRSTHVRRSSAIAHRRSSQVPDDEHESAGTGSGLAPDDSNITEGKRPPTSPSKDPTPKRRRTLQSSDLKDDENAPRIEQAAEPKVADSVPPAADLNDSVIDAAQPSAHPELFAQKQLLRPRNPTPSQRRREQIQAEIMEATEAFLLSSPKLGIIHEMESPLEPGSSPKPAQALAVASEIASFSVKMQKGMRDDRRKRSVTTQDFLDEAMKIMEFIRTKGRPTSGLGSLEETQLEQLEETEAEMQSTALTFSRPPSREGATGGWRDPSHQPLDSSALSKLHRYQEDDTGDFMPSSIRSTNIQRARSFSQAENEILESEPVNIRIHPAPEPSSSDRKRGSRRSVDSIVGTNYTNMSRRSENVQTLAPEAVAHLIPKEVAGMSFDRERGVWVKRKHQKPSNPDRLDISATNLSEDDPFGNIPDLTVDDTQELHAAAQTPARNVSGNRETNVPLDDTIADPTPQPSRLAGSPQTPQCIADDEIAIGDTSSVPSKYSNFAWSGPQPETRATSWNDPELTLKSRKANGLPRVQTVAQPLTRPGGQATDNVDHEYSINEGRHVSKAHDGERKRDVTISFSSPFIPRANTAQPEDGAPEDGDANTSLMTTQKNSYPQPSHRPFTSHHELSFIGKTANDCQMKVSVSLSTPWRGREGPLSEVATQVPPTPYGHGDATFMLSDLPEFTVNQVDERELPGRTIVKRNDSGSHHEIEDRYGLGMAELVRALQDAEPDEPYWEHLRQLDIHEKWLPNLNRLEEFCWQLEALDASHNYLSQLVGVPSTVRRLNVRHNALTSLTSWTHLTNIQFLDVSSNDIDSLAGFSNLVHLRELKANDNRIKSLHGIENLDGLIKLDLAQNKVARVNFEGFNLKCLAELDLSGNQVSEVKGLHRLPQLKYINLDDNDLERYPSAEEDDTYEATVRRVSMCHNKLTSLNVKSLPFLEHLDVDGNYLSIVNNIEHLQHLKSLSARQQQPLDATPSFLQQNDIHSLHLSLNAIPALPVTDVFLNLKHLEITSSGLHTLPADFGLRAPNIRYLNLNHNALKDLRPLLNTKRLTTLLVAGNRLGRMRKNLAVLATFHSLEEVDLRDNPLTLGFYAPLVEQRVVSASRRIERRGSAADHVAEAPQPQAADDAADDDDHLPLTEDRPFTLPPVDKAADARYLARLDPDTRLRRRVYEVLLVGGCRRLRRLDGLELSRPHVLRKDEVWAKLKALGVLKRKAEEEGEGEVGERSARASVCV